MEFFGVNEFSFMYYDFKNGFHDNYEKSCSLFKNNVNPKIKWGA